MWLRKTSFAPFIWPSPTHVLGFNLEVNPSGSHLLPAEAETGPFCIPKFNHIILKLPVSSDCHSHWLQEPTQQGLFLIHIFTFNA